jgi:murein DD-endopeptidase MepM/ murein hydrolase activator NlpD
MAVPMHRAIALLRTFSPTAWVERAVYGSLLLLSSDAAAPPPTAADTAARVAWLLEASELDFEPVVRSPPLALPARGEWQVWWGGDDASLNRHVARRSQRRSLDLTIVDEHGEAHRGEGLDNRDYYAYGQPVHAMAAGEVVMVVDGVPDSAPGERTPNYRLGNVVVIRHGAELFSIYGHLIPESATVEPGDVVERGEVVGACGNSGYSRVPHLHVHVQDGPIIGEARGIEPVFESVVVERDGVRSRREKVSLVKGDQVSE